MANRYFQKASMDKKITDICYLYQCYIEIKKENWKKAERQINSVDKNNTSCLYLFLKGLIAYRHKNRLSSTRSFAKIIKKPISINTLLGIDDLEDLAHTIICNQ